MSEFDVKFVRIIIPVRQRDMDIPVDFPFRDGDIWDIRVDIETGKIMNWPDEEGCSVCINVYDSGKYYLLGAMCDEIAKIEEDYVPHDLIPGYHGEYIHFKIDNHGFITNWPKKPDVAPFFPHM